MHGDGERPQLVAEEAPVALHGNGPREPAVLSQLVRLPVQGEPSRGQVAGNRKGGSPFADDRREFPQLNVIHPSPVI